jgi:hypothetical protein
MREGEILLFKLGGFWYDAPRLDGGKFFLTRVVAARLGFRAEDRETPKGAASTRE